jgi:hypothetical protein
VSIKKFPLNDDSPSSSFPGRTEVLYGNENIQRRVLETFSRVNERLDGCTDPTAIVVNVRFDAMWNGFVQIERKGVRLRAITEVTPENISSVKKIMELFEERHLKGIRSNFAILDKKSV